MLHHFQLQYTHQLMHEATKRLRHISHFYNCTSGTQAHWRVCVSGLQSHLHTPLSQCTPEDILIRQSDSNYGLKSKVTDNSDCKWFKPLKCTTTPHRVILIQGQEISPTSRCNSSSNGMLCIRTTHSDRSITAHLQSKPSCDQIRNDRTERKQNNQ